MMPIGFDLLMIWAILSAAITCALVAGWIEAVIVFALVTGSAAVVGALFFADAPLVAVGMALLFVWAWWTR